MQYVSGLSKIATQRQLKILFQEWQSLMAEPTKACKIKLYGNTS